MKRNLLWLAYAALLVVIFGTIYTTVQQAQRRAANMPQIQLAEDTAAALNQGDLPSMLALGKVDMNHSLAPFTIIYDKSGHVVAGSGYLNGKVPTVDAGVLKAAEGKEYHAVTWQPQKDVRVASVSVAAKKYYVLSGRSIKEVEKNENATFLLSLLGGIAALALLAIIFVLGWLNNKEV